MKAERSSSLVLVGWSLIQALALQKALLRSRGVEVQVYSSNLFSRGIRRPSVTFQG